MLKTDARSGVGLSLEDIVENEKDEKIARSSGGAKATLL